MAGLISSPLREELAARRDRYNAAFAAARARWRELDPDLFADLLRDDVAPVVAAAAALRPDRTGIVAEQLYDTALELAGRRLPFIGSRGGCIREAWSVLLPLLPRLVSEDPAVIASLVTNAVWNLAESPEAPSRWMSMAAEYGRTCEQAAQFKAGGTVLAWRAGMPRLRLAALSACRSLDADHALGALGLKPSAIDCALEEILSRLEADPWLAIDNAARAEDPYTARSIRLEGATGAFTGFGGRFTAPPIVREGGGHIFVFDGEGYWRLVADRYGTALLPLESPPDAPATPSRITLDKHGTIRFGSSKTNIPTLSAASSWAAAGTTLAVTLPHSYRVFLLSLPREGA